MVGDGEILPHRFAKMRIAGSLWWLFRVAVLMWVRMGEVAIKVISNVRYHYDNYTFVFADVAAKLSRRHEIGDLRLNL